MKLFKGYVETKNKRSIEKFKNRTDFKTYEQVKNLNEFAGVLGEETILIDIDDQEQSEILLKIVEELDIRCRVNQTDHGKHFLFKNSGFEKCPTKVNLAIGIKADIKVGCKNSYCVLKINGKERKVIYDIFEEEEYQEVPKWLLPISSNTSFLKMENGDGRNQALYNFILTLQSNDFLVDEAKETIRIINKYIMKSPLPESELKVILRSEAFKKPIFFKGTAFLFDKFATYLKNNNHIIKINNQLHIYQDGIYVNGQAEIEAQMIKDISSLNRAKRTEVLSYLDILIRDNTPMSDANLIAFKNGVYNLVDESFSEFNYSHIITNKIDWNYNPEAYSELADKTLSKLSCGDAEIRMLMEEIIGYTFYRRNELRKAFIFIGDKANGKSTYIDMIKTMLGDNNTAALDLKELGDRFKTAELFGKLANLGDDIGDEFIPNAAVFKKLVSGDRLNVERKGQNPFDFNNYAKFIFSANNMPRIKDKTGAVLDRLIIIPFNARFSNQDPDFDPYVKYKLREPECIEYLVKLGIDGLKRVLLNRQFTLSEKVKRELEEYEEANNPILGFFKEYDEDSIKNELVKDVYQKYTEFCIVNNFQALSNIEFTRQVNKKFNLEVKLKRIQGERCKVFMKRGE